MREEKGETTFTAESSAMKKGSGDESGNFAEGYIRKAERLAELGYPFDMCIEALKSNGNRVDTAAGWLTVNAEMMLVEREGVLHGEAAGAGDGGKTDEAGDGGGQGVVQLEEVGWTCGMCTVVNDPIFLACSVCGSPRGDTAAAEERDTLDLREAASVGKEEDEDDADILAAIEASPLQANNVGKTAAGAGAVGKAATGDGGVKGRFRQRRWSGSAAYVPW